MLGNYESFSKSMVYSFLECFSPPAFFKFFFQLLDLFHLSNDYITFILDGLFMGSKQIFDLFSIFICHFTSTLNTVLEH
jgi:hypothetical protein